MNNLSPLGLITCFIFSMMLNGTSISSPHDHVAIPEAYITNYCKDTIFFKPESRKSNPGLDPNGAYALAPGESYYLPFDAVVTPAVEHGRIYRLPTGARVVIDEQGIPRPSNIVAKTGIILRAYGYVESPCVNFAKLANPKGSLIRVHDITRL